MSWLVKLYETYNNCEKEFVGGDEEKNKFGNVLRPLLPIYHSTQTAHVEITINENGDFLRAEAVIKENASTIIPITEKSVGRTTGSAPHALNDTLQYIAGELSEKINVDFNKFHKDYIDQLEKWHNFDPANKKINAVLTYLKKYRLIDDLINREFLIKDDNDLLIPNSKYIKETKETRSIFCRFNVQIYNEKESHTYKDHDLYNSWIRFQDSLESNYGLCYATGDFAQIASSHPKYIRNTGDGAKLISSNDDTVVTYKGRFADASQACGIGSVVSNKAHSALKWLISRQAYNKNGHTILAWTEKNKYVPNEFKDNVAEADDEDFGEDDETPTKSDTKELFAARLNKKLAGYKQNLDPNVSINIIALDSATPGRMSIIYYREMDNAEYFKNLEQWYDSCCWHIEKYIQKDDQSKGKMFRGISSPTVDDIIRAAYGYGDVDDKIKHSTITRLLPCIIENAPIPADIVTNAVTKTSNRIGYQTKRTDNFETDWNKALQTTCALYRKFNIKENYNMALEENRTTRDYLYGRLLALAENIESWAISDMKENRPTSASRYFAQFAAQPYRTWLIIEKSIKPYIDKLEGKATGRIRLIDEVMSMFDYDDFIGNKQLSGEFLLGYHTQRRALYEKTNNNKNNENENNEVEA